jgi:hypothetical protein
MLNQVYYSVPDVAALLGETQHAILHAVAYGRVVEPLTTIGGKGRYRMRLFTAEQAEVLREYFATTARRPQST